MKRIIVYVVLITLALALPVKAEGNQPLKVEPSRFILEGKPGQEITGSITITNDGSDSATAKVVLSDWSLDQSSNLIVQDAGTLDTSLSNMIKFNPRQFKLKPKGVQTVRFSIKIPRDAKPGEKRGLISAEQSSTFTDSAGAVVKTQIASTIYVAVAPIERKCQVMQASIKPDSATNTTKVTLDLKGIGNAHFRGTGSFAILKPGEKRPVAQGDFGPVILLPGGTVRFSAQSKGVISPGRYQMSLTIKPEMGEARVVTYEFSL